MDPIYSQSVYESRAVQLVYETVLNIDYYARPYKLVPGACYLPEVSPDGTTYTFKVRSPDLTANEVKASLLRLKDPELVSPNAWLVRAVDSIKVLDARTVQIQLKQRLHVFPWMMALAGASVIKADGEGTGPYYLKSWWKNHEMVFERRKPTMDGFDTIKYLVIDDPSTQWLMFLKGELDFLGEVARDNWDMVVNKNGELNPELKKLGISMHSIPTMELMYIGINMTDPVLGPNKPLRQALNAAFDYPAWERFYSGRIVPADGPVPPGVAGKLDKPFKYAFNLEKAKALMVEAGYPGGIDSKTGRRLTLSMAIGRPTQDSREAAELIAAFYEKIGIKLELKFYTWDAFLKAVGEGRTQMFRIGWVGDYPDAENFLQLFHSRNLRPGPNRTAYTNPAFDKAYDSAMAATTEAERNQYWYKCQEIICEDCPWVFNHVNKATSLTRPTVKNYIPSDFPYGQEQYFKAK